MPAGTGVWVVNTVLARTTVSAVSKSRPAADVGHVLTDPLDPEEPGVALVHVEDLGRRQPLDLGERADRAHTADARQDLLLDAVLLVAAVEPVGDAAHVVVVLRNVGVQQQQRHPADLGDPDPGPQLCPFRHRQVHQGRFPRLVGEQPQRQPLRVVRRVRLVLPTVGGQRLPEVARPIEQADGDQRQAQIRRRFEVVTRQDAEATGVVRQHLGHAELHREVRDPGRHRPRPAVPGTSAAGSGRCPDRRPRRRGAAGTSWSAASSSSRLGLTAPRSATGSCSCCAHNVSSMLAKSSWVGVSHDDRRLNDRRSSAARRSGRWARTVNLRRAFTRR